MRQCYVAALAVPGDLATLTGGYHYDRRILEGLRALGRDVTHIRLANAFPQPSPADQSEAGNSLAAVPANCPVIIDGLAMGAMAYDTLAAVKAPIVALVHHPLAEEGGLTSSLRARFFRSERDNLALAAHVIVTSPHTAELLRRRYAVAPESITVAVPGIDRPAGVAKPLDPPLILSVGTQIHRKGHDVLLRALARLTERAWRAIVVGSVRDRSHGAMLAKLVTELDLADRVHLAGEVTPDKLESLYNEATVFALATRYEGYGMVFDEAMIHGLPVVSCATGAVSSTVASGAGKLVNPDDPSAFAAALGEVLDDDEARCAMAVAATAAGSQLPRWEDTARVVAGVLDGVLANA